MLNNDKPPKQCTPGCIGHSENIHKRFELDIRWISKSHIKGIRIFEKLGGYWQRRCSKYHYQMLKGHEGTSAHIQE